ncbi:c-type cytochrome [Prolixibacteraceae bacterium JC049]|nr:c-type cytochrome [Prolixibacteraceae bacterium JC049]
MDHCCFFHYGNHDYHTIGKTIPNHLNLGTTRRNRKKSTVMKYLVIIILLITSGTLWAQSSWKAPDKAQKQLSPLVFDEDMAQQGRQLYSRSCASCHGTVSKNNYAIMIPAPGDPASEGFQNQTDGSLFYKIQKGKGAMPAFEDVYGTDEIWAMVAYFRSFNKNYEQQLMQLDGVEKFNFKTAVAYDFNIDKLVVKVTSDDKFVENVEVAAFVKGMFGNLALGKAKTNTKGIAYFDVDADMPGDTKGNLNFYVKVNKNYSYAKSTVALKVTEPNIPVAVTEGRHLWSPNKDAPIWLIITFWGVVFGIWGAIFYIIFTLFRLKKYKAD